MADIDRIDDVAEIWRPGTGQDPAKYLIAPGTIKKAGKHTPGNLRHARPYITNGTKLFAFPVGPEGFRISGTASLGLHRYIGGKQVAGNTIHFHEGRIELTGLFPGTSSQDQMSRCREILTSDQKNGLRLWMPGVFEESRVLPENWDFSHEPDDRSHSIAYTISFVILEEVKAIPDPHGTPPPPQPTIKTKTKGKPHKVFKVKDGARTLRAISKKVYNNPDLWHRLVTLNQGQLNHWKKLHPKVATHQIPTYRWPIGTKFRY